MSRRGYDLLARENPPAGYHSAAESWRIHRLGSEPANLPPQTIQCTAKFKLFFPKKGSPNGYETFASNGDFSFSLTAGSMSFDEFRSMVAKECENNCEGTGDIVRDAVASGSPRMDWWISLKLRAAPEFNKSAKPKPNINSEAGFLAWINVIVELGNDTTNSCLELVMENPASTKKKSKTDAAARVYKLTRQAAQDKLVELHKPNTKYETRLPVFLHLTKDDHYIPLTGAVLDIWAKALEKHVDGVSYYSPPASIKFVKISDAKRRRLDHERLRHGNSPSPESDPPALIEPNEDLLRKYIELVIKPEKQEKVMKILVDHDIAHPNSFKSKTITVEKMLKWGLSDGIVAHISVVCSLNCSVLFIWPSLFRSHGHKSEPVSSVSYPSSII
ncbi:hypothetical protein Pst134EA_015100 [Puccinia striiformis f. sp. tritici]|uniref:hypothetical protein n=1 Tax=Puccinia striiformis f. sp. tritici TaxID=168172 RepID=UPI002008DC7B|nr:hypothetical protein Pst134EA_015100 [Puccinia striiformis f. sp. tritici]KAH9463013.1 hypothetical protein Pst134EA_015100 [Puccinia striiformis f. sp. tritici]